MTSPSVRTRAAMASEPIHGLTNLLQHFLGGAVVNVEFPRDTIPDVATGSGQVTRR
jgi:hypothetical protein